MSFEHVFLKGTSACTLLLLHGTGGDEHDLLQLGKTIAPNANLLSPRGKVQEHGMNRFFKRFASGAFDEESVRTAAKELDAFVKEQALEHAFDPKKTIALGYSNGANTAAAMLLERPSSLAGAVLLHGMIPLEGKKTKLGNKPVFLSAGKNDQLISSDKVMALEELLRECGARVTSHWAEGGHEVSRKEVLAARAWFEKEFG